MAFVLLVLEAVRRTSGWIMLFVICLFLAYGVRRPVAAGAVGAPRLRRVEPVGLHVPDARRHLRHRRRRVVVAHHPVHDLRRVPAAIGRRQVLSSTGASPRWAASTAGAGRTVVLASFLLGGPSGSGVATTVTIGSVAYPMLERAGYGKDAAGGLLAAGGLGAIISPPVLGAAAFLIAEFLKISYLDVLLMATVPTLLYYLSLFLMVELDTRKFGMPNVAVAVEGQLGVLTQALLVPLRVAGRDRRVHGLGLLADARGVLGDGGHVRGVVPAPRHGDGLAQGVAALRDGSGQMLNVAATCAAAGIIVGVVAKTGLGLKFSAIVIAYAGGSLFLTALYTALIVWVIGLAVPVTASYIICAVIAAPALTKLGVPDFAAHMFIFYYAVLSEVSPPTALSPFAAAAITGGDPYRTTLQSWKYTLPAFVVPFVFVLDPAGVALLLKMPPDGVVAPRRVDRVDRVHRDCRAGGGRAEVAACARAARVERWMLVACGLLLIYPAPAARLDRASRGVVGTARRGRRLRRRQRAQGRREPSPCTMRKVDELFARYGESHRNPANKAIHWVCVPLITWSVLAALWAWSPVGRVRR